MQFSLNSVTQAPSLLWGVFFFRLVGCVLCRLKHGPLYPAPILLFFLILFRRSFPDNLMSCFSFMNHGASGKAYSDVQYAISHLHCIIDFEIGRESCRERVSLLV